jgi:exodeoxyribonuclease V alpha subunit
LVDRGQSLPFRRSRVTATASPGATNTLSTPSTGANQHRITDHEVYNGDLGIVQRIDQDEGELIVTFDGRDVSYGFGELDELMLAYAMTIHKSQGSEYPAVVIPLVTQHYMMLARNLVYTSVTHGKRLVVLIGQWKALAIAVRKQGPRQRWGQTA